MQFYIMNYNTPLVSFETSRTGMFGEIQIINIQNIEEEAVVKSLLKCEVSKWIEHRKPAQNRANIDKLLAMCQIKDVEGYLMVTYALSLNDALWVKPEDTNLTWEKINLYNNPFKEVISQLAFSGNGLGGNQLATTSPEFTTNGMLMKCWRRINKKIYLYKGGTEGAINTGLEPYSEAFATQVCKAMGLDHFVPYDVSQYRNKTVSRCELFTTEETGFKSQNTIYVHATFEELFQHMKRTPYFRKFADMLILDAIILNVDRHLNNWGYLTNNSTGEIIDIAPIFDNGLGFIPYFYSSEKDYYKQEAEMIAYADEQVMSSGLDFIVVAKECMNQKIRSALISLKDFKLKNIKGFSEERLKLLNCMLQRQLEKLL